MTDVIAGKLDHACWLHDHIFNCPRCQARIVRFGQVDLALMMLKSQPHSRDLVMKANTSAIGMLKHSLRQAPAAEKLQHFQADGAGHDKYGRHMIPLLKMAACLAVVLILKLGIFSSMENFRREGNSAIGNYYARHLGQEYADDIFHA
ncbi:MAG: hypothetical protein IH624_04745 [Phycisphaerae bacterium]|nr:hypothetical protein [Phycisphaerae bacterium]